MDKTAFIAFYTVYPSNMGSSEVSSSFFQSWKGEKKIFQISHVKKIINRKVFTCFIKKENPINKLLKIFKLTLEVKKYLTNSLKQNIIIEGPSWIGYSFFFFFLARIILPKAFFIYHSHSIEYEIRKKNSNLFISFITRIMEDYIFNNVHISTSVSKREKNRIKKLYKKNTIIFPNGIYLKKLICKKKIFLTKYRYIFYSGSYLYKPNKKAIDLLNNYFMPALIKKFPNLKLILTGGGYSRKYDWLINLGIVRKDKLIKFLQKSQLILVPIYEGYGTRIKIIEALILGVPVVSTYKGIEGIIYKRSNCKVPLVSNNKKKLLNYTTNVLKNNKQYKKFSNQNNNLYREFYSMENITKKFQKYISKFKSV